MIIHQKLKGALGTMNGHFLKMILFQFQRINMLTIPERLGSIIVYEKELFLK